MPQKCRTRQVLSKFSMANTRNTHRQSMKHGNFKLWWMDLPQRPIRNTNKRLKKSSAPVEHGQNMPMPCNMCAPRWHRQISCDANGVIGPLSTGPAVEAQGNHQGPGPPWLAHLELLLLPLSYLSFLVKGEWLTLNYWVLGWLTQILPHPMGQLAPQNKSWGLNALRKATC